jgi:hypothetical protein
MPPFNRIFREIAMNRSWVAGLCGIAALALVGRWVRGPQEKPSPRPSSVVASWAPHAARRGPPGNPGESDRALADRLVGYWRGETIQGVTTSFRFDAGGLFACSVDQVVDGRAPVIHGGAAGEWRVEGGQLRIRWIQADNSSFREWIGRSAQSKIGFDGGDWVRLAGVEGDNLVRTYRRAY